VSTRNVNTAIALATISHQMSRSKPVVSLF